MWKEFKAFLLKGNILDLAVAFIIGAAFNKIVTSLVNDLLMPPIGYLLSNVDVKDLKLHISEEVSINYGLFLQSLIDFVLVGLSVFVIVKAYNKLQKKKEEAPKAPEPSNQEKLLAEIRDLLKKNA
jgi:large conductance mechanosensitive channel